MTQQWQALQPGDVVQIVAPASKTKNPVADLKKVSSLLASWGLRPRVSKIIFGKNSQFPDLANTDEKRFADLQSAILDPDVKAIWCIRGGYGTVRLLTYLQNNFKNKPVPKLFVGFSDITNLHNYFHQQWDWNTIHGPHPLYIATDKVALRDVKTLRQLMFGEITETKISDLQPLNKAAKVNRIINSTVVGGNIMTFSFTCGTDFALDFNNKILLVEDVDEPFRKVDGTLQQLMAQKQQPAAVIVGDFTIKDAVEKKAINNALKFFAKWLETHDIPALRCVKIGHGKDNHPVPLGSAAQLILGEKPCLILAAK